MKVFISWSGKVSKNIAEVFREWLPQVIQSLDPWMSSSDIEKGARWGNDIGSNLDNTNFGIVCLTPDNLQAPWVLFETGALSKSLDSSKVCPILFKLESTDIEGPLVQFQSCKINKDDIFDLVKSMNTSLEDGRLDDAKLRNSFDVWWPNLEKNINNIDSDAGHSKKERTQKDYLKEILGLVRAIHKNEIFELPLASHTSTQAVLSEMTSLEKMLLQGEFELGDPGEYKAFRASLGIPPEAIDEIIDAALRKLRHPPQKGFGLRGYTPNLSKLTPKEPD